MKQKQLIPSVNYHLWQPCNMRCGFCFAKFQDVKSTILPKGHLPKEESLRTVELLAEYGFTKITFVGGEPTLCPWISDLIKLTKEKGLTTMLVTNGTRLTEEFLSDNQKYLDWIAISVDSLNRATNQKSGRVVKRVGVDSNYYYDLIKRIKNYDYKLKINTVVSVLNYEENMSDFMKYTSPQRWKIFKVLPIVGQNDNRFNEFEVSDENFRLFLNKHKNIGSLVKEDNNDMTGSYLMIDPAGRFFDNVKGKHTYSSKIIDSGVKKSLAEIFSDYYKFINRDGLYEW